MPYLDAESEFYRKRVIEASVMPALLGGGAYAVGDNVGGKLMFSSVVQLDDLGGYIHSLTMTDKGAEAAVLDLVLFSADPTLSTFTDNAAMVVHATDVDKIVGFIPIVAADYITVSAGIMAACVRGAGAAFDLSAAGNDLYAALRVNTGAPTYAVGDLVVKLGIAQG